MKKILFFTPYGAWQVHHQLDAIIASALRIRGDVVCVIRCDGILNGCECYNDCHRCREAGNVLFNPFSLPSVQLGSYISQDDYKRSCEWLDAVSPDDYQNACFEGLPIGEWITSSMFSIFKIDSDGLSRPEIKKFHRAYLRNGLLIYKSLSRIIDEFDPTNMVVFNARLAPYRIAFEIAQKRGIPVITHERGFVDDTFVLFEDKSCLSSKPLFKIVNIWKDVPLSKEQLLLVKQYLVSREHGKDMNFPSFYDYQTDYVQICHKLRIPAGSKILAIFTSSEYELVFCEDYKSITSQLDTIDTLIDIYKDREDYLVIRHHPHIGQSPETGFLTRAYQQALNAPHNVRIIMPSEQLNSYALLRNINAAIAFFSSLGYEASARGIATAAFPQSPNCCAMRYNIADSSKEYLTQLIENLLNQAATFDIEDFRRTFRFIYSYIFRTSVHFKSFGIVNNFQASIRIKSLAEMNEGVDPALDKVIENILNGSSLMDGPLKNDHVRSRLEEDIFFKEYADEIKTQYREVREKALVSQLYHQCDIGVIYLTKDIRNNDMLSASLKRSRHKNIIVHQCDGDSLNSILLKLGDVKENYIHVAIDFIQYDESFLSSAIDVLLDIHHLNKKGISYGAWILSDDGVIEKEIFTKRLPDPGYQVAVNFLPLLKMPQIILSFCLFRRDALIEILHDVIQTTAGDDMAKKLFQVINSPDVVRSNLPMMLIPKSI